MNRTDLLTTAAALIGLMLTGAGLWLSIGPGPALLVPGLVLTGWAIAADVAGAMRRS